MPKVFKLSQTILVFPVKVTVALYFNVFKPKCDISNAIMHPLSNN